MSPNRTQGPARHITPASGVPTPSTQVIVEGARAEAHQRDPNAPREAWREEISGGVKGSVRVPWAVVMSVIMLLVGGGGGTVMSRALGPSRDEYSATVGQLAAEHEQVSLLRQEVTRLTVAVDSLSGEIRRLNAQRADDAQKRADDAQRALDAARVRAR